MGLGGLSPLAPFISASCCLRYASNESLKMRTFPGDATHSSSQMELTRCSSCEMTSIPPSKERSAWMSASTASRSRWLVGSSSSSRCGFCHMTCAKATRDFCPPESVLIRCSAMLPPRPIPPRCARISSGLALGYCL
mmetsp:Transcript_50603/g.108081  ORF Transcript_50603/g.108081 Transcript_50603/m.108081 type:complete len:137 (+) Transcript_50603:351-761(+)